MGQQKRIMLCLVGVFFLFFLVACERQETIDLANLSEEELDNLFLEEQDGAIAGRAYFKEPSKTASGGRGKIPVVCREEGERITLQSGRTQQSLPKFFCGRSAVYERMCTRSGYTSRIVDRCSNTETCLESLCIPQFEIVCEEPCPLSGEYIEARREGINKSIFALYNLTGTTLDKRGYPLYVHLTGDHRVGNGCGEYPGTEFAFVDRDKYHICLYDIERNQTQGVPLDPELVRNKDILTIHELSHLLWVGKAPRLPYTFQEGFAVGISHIIAAPAIDSFCHWSFSHPDPDTENVVHVTENFWYRLCNEFGFDNSKISHFFTEIERRVQEKGIGLDLPEVKQAMDIVLEENTEEIFEEAGLNTIPLAEGANCNLNWECQVGLACIFSACQHVICLDSDNGENNPSSRGMVTQVASLSENITMYDSCIDENTINEFECLRLVDVSWNPVPTTCPEGTTCQEGVCS